MSGVGVTPDPYDLPPPWWRRHAEALTRAVVFVASVVLTVVAFPPFHLPEAGYVLAVPALFWAYRRPAWKVYAWTVLGAQAVAWTMVLSWLHHVSWLGWLLLGPFVGVWVGSWFLAARWVMPRLLGRPVLTRIAAVWGLAALWVVIEWTRTWLLTGFPWLPLSVSQWERISILQIASITGGWGVSFVLIAMNLGFAAYGHRLFKEGKRGLQRRSQEFFACLFLLVICLTVHVQETFSRGQFAVPLGRFGFVQPAIPQTLKWDETQDPMIRGVLETATRQAASGRPDLILWPEASTPYALKGDPGMQEWTERLAQSVRVPLLVGSLAVETPFRGEERWFNAAFVVDPQVGVSPGHYGKRHLVPFGEYVPLRPVLGWLKKVVPIGGDFVAGDDARPLVVAVRNQGVALGPLICFEDVFPSLARSSVRSGADVLVVLTNNAWFGQEGAAVQHAAHSVLRAVETRRPVLRDGNAGWSGWIDEYGVVRAMATDPAEGIYFRGARVVDVTRDSRWISRESFYVEHGDWFVLICALLVAFAYAMLRFAPPPVFETEDPGQAPQPLP